MGTLRCARWAAYALAAFVVLVGCQGGPATGEVSGTVTVDGNTPPHGSSITFVPVDGKSPTAGALLEDGRYSVRVPVGMAKVEIRVPRPIRKIGPKVDGPGADGTLIEESLPAKYNDESELTIEVKSGSNKKDWELQGK